MTDVEMKLVSALMRHSCSCPLKDDAQVDFEKECKGYREDGCAECIVKHIDDVN